MRETDLWTYPQSAPHMNVTSILREYRSKHPPLTAFNGEIVSVEHVSEYGTAFNVIPPSTQHHPIRKESIALPVTVTATCSDYAREVGDAGIVTIDGSAFPAVLARKCAVQPSLILFDAPFHCYYRL